MELRDHLRVVRKRWALITSIALLGVGAAGAYSALKTPEYSSTATVFVSTAGGDSVTDLAQGNSFTQQRVKTYAELVAAPIVLDPVIEELDLEPNADELATQITATAPLNTTLIRIDVTDPDPELAARLATEVSESLTTAVEEIERTRDDQGAFGVSPVRLTLVKPATVPDAPTSPNAPLNLALGLIAGLTLGFGAAILREALDTRVHGERDLALITDHTVLGGIPVDPKDVERPLIVREDPSSPRAEAFRTLRTNLQFLDIGRDERAFVITSSIEGEGKSTTVANLAIALSDAGARVALVDADLRKPMIATYMELEGGAGLTDVLIGRASLADVMQRWGRGQLAVLPSGPIPPNPSELLGSAQMARVVRELTTAFDIVLFDSPPLLPVTDAAVLARIVGGAIVVVAANRVHRSEVTKAFTALENVGAPVSGIVLTLPGKRAGGYGYGYGYAYTGGHAGASTVAGPAPA